MRAFILLLACLPLALVSCGGASDPKSLTDEGSQALNTNDYAGAQAKFEAALAALGEDHANPVYDRAHNGWLEALAHNDPARCKAEFLEMAASSDLSAEDYSRVCGWLAGSRQFSEALAVVHEGQKKYPEHPQLAQVIAALKVAAESDPALASEMEGLGYL